MAEKLEYSPLYSRNRIRLLQKIIYESDASNQPLKPTILLFVMGQDGRYNSVSQTLLKYLFLGAFSRELQGAPQTYCN